MNGSGEEMDLSEMTHTEGSSGAVGPRLDVRHPEGDLAVVNTARIVAPAIDAASPLTSTSVAGMPIKAPSAISPMGHSPRAVLIFKGTRNARGSDRSVRNRINTAIFSRTLQARPIA